MRPFTSTISLAEARRRLSDAVSPITRTETVSLTDANSRVVSTDVQSRIDVPPFARSGMDGYAVIAADTLGATQATPVRLRVVERIYTAQVPAWTIERGTCAEIATGAVIPAGADAIVIVENTVSGDRDEAVIVKPVVPGQNVTPRGNDITSGSLVARAGGVLNPSRIGALAAVGCESVEVYAKPVVAILSTGDEIVQPGSQLKPGEIFDVNRFTLTTIISAHGGVATSHHSARDTMDALSGALDRCLEADIVVCSGGSSVGERDLILDVVRSRGQMIFHGIAVKPGKPTAFAIVEGKPFFGMPGYPASCLSNAHVLLLPFIRATARLPPYAPQIVRAPLGRRVPSADRHLFYTVRIENGTAWPAYKGSGDITSMSLADGYIEVPLGTGGLEAGDEVEVTLF
jgi:molybdopterin molybdotransferase